MICHSPCQPINHVIYGQVFLHDEDEYPECFVLLKNLDQPPDDVVHGLDIALNRISPDICSQNPSNFFLIFNFFEKRLVTKSPLDIFVDLSIVRMRPLGVAGILLRAKGPVVFIRVVFEVPVGSSDREPILPPQMGRDSFDNNVFKHLSILGSDAFPVVQKVFLEVKIFPIDFLLLSL